MATPPHCGEGCGDTLNGRGVIEKGSSRTIQRHHACKLTFRASLVIQWYGFSEPLNAHPAPGLHFESRERAGGNSAYGDAQGKLRLEHFFEPREQAGHVAAFGAGFDEQA